MEINEVLMKRGMFLTFWLRTKNDYYNVKSELTETAVFKKEIKTEFVRNQDELISGRFSKSGSSGRDIIILCLSQGPGQGIGWGQGRLRTSTFEKGCSMTWTARTLTCGSLLKIIFLGILQFMAPYKWLDIGSLPNL